VYFSKIFFWSNLVFFSELIKILFAPHWDYSASAKGASVSWIWNYLPPQNKIMAKPLNSLREASHLGRFKTQSFISSLPENRFTMQISLIYSALRVRPVLHDEYASVIFKDGEFPFGPIPFGLLLLPLNIFLFLF